jgi:CRP-like cAMP-binding protein
MRRYKLFTLNFSNEFLDELSLLVKERRFNPEEIIFRKGDAPQQLYFLLKGTCEVIDSVERGRSGEAQVLATIVEGETLGVEEFFSQQQRRTTIKNATVSTLAYIEIEEF